MELQHTFTVPVPPEQAFSVLQDIERIGPCMPGASIDSVDGSAFTGKVKVKIGPIQVTYGGEAEYVDVDAEALTATITARGKETRGAGTANATVRAAITSAPEGAEVHVVTDLAITGKPAQFGRGVMEEVGQKLINRFAECLSSTLGEPEAAGPHDAEGASTPGVDDGGADSGTDSEADSETDGSADAPRATTGEASPVAGATDVTAARTQPRTPAADPEAIDLLDIAGGSVAKRVGPVLGGLVVLLLLRRWLRRR